MGLFKIDGRLRVYVAREVADRLRALDARRRFGLQESVKLFEEVDLSGEVPEGLARLLVERGYLGLDESGLWPRNYWLPGSVEDYLYGRGLEVCEGRLTLVNPAALLASILRVQDAEENARQQAEREEALRRAKAEVEKAEAATARLRQVASDALRALNNGRVGECRRLLRSAVSGA